MPWYGLSRGSATGGGNAFASGLDCAWAVMEQLSKTDMQNITKLILSII
jgi:hypothetical protein